MPKKTLLSALLISSFSLSTAFAAAAAEVAQSDVKESTATHEVSTQKPQDTTKSRTLGINGLSFETFPFARSTENNVNNIVIKRSVLSVIDPWFFQNNPSLRKVLIEDSVINLNVFEGHTFLDGCDGIESVSFRGTTGVELAPFLEQIASPTLLQRILDRNCSLIIDMPETGTTMANFAKDGVVKEDAIHFAIRTAKILEVIQREKAAHAVTASPEAASAETASVEPKPKGWLSRFTFGYLEQ